MGDQAMRVDTSLADSISAATKSAKTPSAASTQKSSGQSSFKSVLKAASGSTDAGKQSTVAETTQAVPGHAYAEILTGPRAGMYINTTHNKRAGQAFVLVERNGVAYHVYGTGKHRTVIEMRRHTAPPASTTSTTTSGSVTPDTSASPISSAGTTTTT
jgi:uncharacterized membrane protein YebE (DUF533 family)